MSECYSLVREAPALFGLGHLDNAELRQRALSK